MTSPEPAPPPPLHTPPPPRPRSAVPGPALGTVSWSHISWAEFRFPAAGGGQNQSRGPISLGLGVESERQTHPSLSLIIRSSVFVAPPLPPPHPGNTKQRGPHCLSPGVWTVETSRSQPEGNTQKVPNTLIFAPVTVVVRDTVGWVGAATDPVGPGCGTAVLAAFCSSESSCSQSCFPFSCSPFLPGSISALWVRARASGFEQEAAL